MQTGICLTAINLDGMLHWRTLIRITMLSTSIVTTTVARYTAMPALPSAVLNLLHRMTCIFRTVIIEFTSRKRNCVSSSTMLFWVKLSRRDAQHCSEMESHYYRLFVSLSNEICSREYTSRSGWSVTSVHVNFFFSNAKNLLSALRRFL